MKLKFSLLRKLVDIRATDFHDAILSLDFMFPATAPGSTGQAAHAADESLRTHCRE